MTMAGYHQWIDPTQTGGILAGSGGVGGPLAGSGGGGFLGGLRGLLDPQYALPMAAQLIGGATPQASFAGALGVAGPAFGDMRRRAAINDWMKAGAPKDPSHPAVQALMATSPEIAQKIIGSQFAAPSLEGQTSTIKTYDPITGTTKVMQFNPQTGQYDREAGIAPPASGMSIEYGPDGSLRIVEGEGVTGNKLPLNRGAATDVEKEIGPLEEQKQQVEHIGDLYDPSFLTYRGKLRSETVRQKEKLADLPLVGPMLAPSEEDKAFLEKKTRFTQNVEQVFNKYRKDITGAAAALAELDRLKQAVINTDQSPREFEAAMSEFSQALKRGLDIKKDLLHEGIPLGSTQFTKEFERRFLTEGGSAAAAPVARVAPAGAPIDPTDPWGLR
jgi:hypothetical protein